MSEVFQGVGKFVQERNIIFNIDEHFVFFKKRQSIFENKKLMSKSERSSAHRDITSLC